MADGSGFGVCPPDVRSAADTITRISDDVREVVLRPPLADLAAALPGGATAAEAPGCTLAGDEGVHGWATRAHDHALAMTGAVRGYENSDRWPPIGPGSLPSLYPDSGSGGA